MARGLPDNPDEVQMSFGEHLEELRRRLIRALLGLLVASALALAVGQHLVTWLLRPLAQEQLALGLPVQTYSLTILSGFFTYIKVSLVAALVLALPWIVYQLWQFVATGLYPRERRAVNHLVPFSAVMALAGVLFTYYAMLRPALAFLLYFASSYPPALSPPQSAPAPATQTAPAPPATQDAATRPAPLLVRLPILAADPADPIEGQAWVNSSLNEFRVIVHGRARVHPLSVPSQNLPLIGLDDYINLVLLLMLAVAITFQVPVLMLVIGWTGLIEPQVLARGRRFVLFACFALAAIITPTADPFNMTLLAVPMYVLFEFGLILMRQAYRRRQRAAAEE